jgi:acyl-CoA reductase-like NAD-dependent aldehyde dehydrogenase
VQQVLVGNSFPLAHMTILVSEYTISQRHYIICVRVDSAESFEVFSPIDQVFLVRVAQASRAQVGDAVSTAHAAFPVWPTLPAVQNKLVFNNISPKIAHSAPQV